MGGWGEQETKEGKQGEVIKIAGKKGGRKRRRGREMGGNCVGSDRHGNDSGEKEGRGTR